jgi:hypothetical protein
MSIKLVDVLHFTVPRFFQAFKDSDRYLRRGFVIFQRRKELASSSANMMIGMMIHPSGMLVKDMVVTK